MVSIGSSGFGASSPKSPRAKTSSPKPETPANSKRKRRHSSSSPKPSTSKSEAKRQQTLTEAQEAEIDSAQREKTARYELVRAKDLYEANNPDRRITSYPRHIIDPLERDVDTASQTFQSKRTARQSAGDKSPTRPPGLNADPERKWNWFA